jgi:hypothetical protein
LATGPAMAPASQRLAICPSRPWRQSAPAAARACSAAGSPWQPRPAAWGETLDAWLSPRACGGPSSSWRPDASRWRVCVAPCRCRRRRSCDGRRLPRCARPVCWPPDGRPAWRRVSRRPSASGATLRACGSPWPASQALRPSSPWRRDDAPCPPPCRQRRASLIPWQGWKPSYQGYLPPARAGHEGSRPPATGCRPGTENRRYPGRPNPNRPSYHHEKDSIPGRRCHHPLESKPEIVRACRAPR